jgi:hypothetical protein
MYLWTVWLPTYVYSIFIISAKLTPFPCRLVFEAFLFGLTLHGALWQAKTEVGYNSLHIVLFRDGEYGGFFIRRSLMSTVYDRNSLPHRSVL